MVNCARLHLDELLLSETQELLRKSLSWGAILAAGELHGVASLLHYHLSRIDGLAHVPAAARGRLLQLTHRAAYQNQQFFTALREVLVAFGDAGIPAMVLKGPSLCQLIYKRVSLRPLIDLNLLVHATQWPAATAVLSRLGYRAEIPAAREWFYRWRYSQLRFLRSNGFPVQLFLQWDLVNWPKLHTIDYGRVWQEAQRVRLSDTDALIPSATDLMLYLGLQLDRHVFLNSAAVHAMDPVEFVFAEWTNNRLIWSTDIAEVIRQCGDAIDWTALVERARAGGIAEPVHAALYWTLHLFNPPVPPGVLDAMHPPSPRRSRQWLFAALASEDTPAALGKVGRSRFKAWWLGKRKAGQLRLIRLLDLLEFIFPRPAELRLRYRPRYGAAIVGIYIAHAGTAIARSALGGFPVLYGGLTGRLSRIARLREALFAGPAGGKDPASRIEKRGPSGELRG